MGRGQGASDRGRVVGVRLQPASTGYLRSRLLLQVLDLPILRGEHDVLLLAVEGGGKVRWVAVEKPSGTNRRARGGVCLPDLVPTKLPEPVN